MTEPEESTDPLVVAVLETLGIDKLQLAHGVDDNGAVEITTQRGTTIAIPRRTEPAT
jgi:hypothetical protein